MSLLTSMMEPCHMMDKSTSTTNTLLGRVDTYTEGAAFQAVIIKNSSPQERVAEQQGVKETFTVVTDKGWGLDFHEVFRRDADGAVFRVVSNQLDSEAPDMSSVQIGKVTAERWVLPA